ncbi:MAG: hypothetical protein N2747_04985 [Chitinophagaceae bacterium]|nr:hypothetical protein [Chitinophagaceae bacterium]
MQRAAFILGFFVLFFSCKKNDAPDPCRNTNYNFTYYKTESIGTSNNGTITITSPVGDTMSYKIGNGPYQASNYFTGLAPGNYIITAKNQKGCTDTVHITILNYGPRYALVKQLITGYCGPCHLNGGNSGGRNFDTDQSIVNGKDRIKARAVDAQPSQMPPAPNAPLTGPDKQKITDWINAGGRITD